MKRIVFLIIASLLVIGLVLPGCGDGNGNGNGNGNGEEVIYTFTDGKINIAVAGPMSYIQGENIWAGATLAKNKIGTVDIGGVAHTLNLIQVETEEIAQPWSGYSASQIENAITVKGADFIFGGFRTEATVGMVEKAMEYKKMFLVTGSATGALLEQVNDNYAKYKYMFRVTPINELWLLNNNIAMLGMLGGGVMQALSTLNPQDVRVAVVSEDLKWTEKPLELVYGYVTTGLNFTYVATELVSDTATSITTELGDIETKGGAHIIFTILSGPVGVTYGKNMGDLAIPSLTMGINVEAQDPGFWDATELTGEGYGAEGMITLGTWAPNIAQSGNLTTDFLDAFIAAEEQFPVYTASSYDGIRILAKAIEETATYDSEAGVASVKADDLIAWYENPANAQTVTSGTAGYYTSAHQGLVDLGIPAYAHDLKYGPDWVTGLGVQWQADDEDEDVGVQIAVWPKAEAGAAANALFLWGSGGLAALEMDWAGFEYTGTEMFDIPMWMIDEWLTP